MRRNALRNVVVGVGIFTLVGCGGSADLALDGANDSTATADALSSAPSAPAAIAVPAENHFAFSLSATGVQIYGCKAVGTGFGWVFQAPEATLFKDGVAVGSHFAGPTWQYQDGSSVVGAKVAAVTVDPTAIPWLLLQAVAHSGDGKLSEVTYIQRLNTAGGLAPASGCDSTTVGSVARVPYSALYAFYKQ